VHGLRTIISPTCIEVLCKFRFSICTSLASIQLEPKLKRHIIKEFAIASDSVIWRSYCFPMLLPFRHFPLLIAGCLDFNDNWAHTLWNPWISWILHWWNIIIRWGSRYCWIGFTQKLESRIWRRRYRTTWWFRHLAILCNSRGYDCRSIEKHDQFIVDQNWLIFAIAPIVAETPESLNILLVLWTIKGKEQGDLRCSI
jgi:hypothetical protein